MAILSSIAVQVDNSTFYLRTGLVSISRLGKNHTSTQAAICTSSHSNLQVSAGIRHQLNLRSSPLKVQEVRKLRVSIKKPKKDASRKASILLRAASCDDHSHCKAVEDSVKSIMKEVLQHCLNKECDGMRHKVLDQMAKGLAALGRVTVVTMTADSKAPEFALTSMTENEDLQQIQRLLQLTSLPFGSASDLEYQHLMNALENSRLTRNDLSLIYGRIGSDVFHCVSPLAMCFPELSLWAKHRALMLPAELVEKLAFRLIIPH